MEKLTTKDKILVIITLGLIITFSLVTKYYSMMI